jgi:hypothetical protein
VSVVGNFAWQNQTVVGVKFLDKAFEHSLSVVVGAAYLLGMLTGGTIVGLRFAVTAAGKGVLFQATFGGVDRSGAKRRGPRRSP